MGNLVGHLRDFPGPRHIPLVSCSIHPMRPSLSSILVISCLPLLFAACGKEKSSAGKNETGHSPPRVTKTDRPVEENPSGDRPGRPRRDTPDYIDADEQSLESVIPTIKPGVETKTNDLSYWIHHRKNITDAEWQKIIDVAAKLNEDQRNSILLHLSIRELDSERGYRLYTSTLDSIKDPEKRAPFFINTFRTSKDPTVISDLLVHLNDHGNPYDTDVAVSGIRSSDSIRGAGAPAFIQALVEDPALAARPKILTMVATELGNFDGSRRLLEMELPPHLANLPAEAEDAYTRAYYRSVLGSAEFTADKKAADILGSSIPPDILIDCMASICSLDVRDYGAQASMSTYQPGASPVGDAYLKNVFRLWSINDRASASRYLDALPTNDPMGTLLREKK